MPQDSAHVLAKKVYMVILIIMAGNASTVLSIQSSVSYLSTQSSVQLILTIKNFVRRLFYKNLGRWLLALYYLLLVLCVVGFGYILGFKCNRRLNGRRYTVEPFSRRYYLCCHFMPWFVTPGFARTEENVKRAMVGNGS